MAKHEFAIGNHEFQVEVGVREGKQVSVTVNGTSYDVELKSEVAAAAIRAAAPSAAAPVAMTMAAPVAAAAAPAAKPAAGGGGAVVAPLAGLVFKRKVNPGDVVKASDEGIGIEAMKMENGIIAGVDGTVQSIEVREQDTVATGDVLMTIG